MCVSTGLPGCLKGVQKKKLKELAEVKDKMDKGQTVQRRAGLQGAPSCGVRPLRPPRTAHGSPPEAEALPLYSS